MLVTTHDLDEAERIADRIVIVDRGRVVAAGTPRRADAAAGGDEFRFGAPPRLDTAGARRRRRRAVDELGAGEYLVRVAPTPTNVAALTAWLADHDLPLAICAPGANGSRTSSSASPVPSESPTPRRAPDECGAGRRRL